MRTKIILAAAILASSAAATAQSPAEIQQQRLEKSHHIVYFGDTSHTADSAQYDALISRFYQNQFRHFQDPRAPYFMLMSRNGNMAMGIGGVLKINGAYDFDGSTGDISFIPYDIPIPKDPAKNTAFMTSPANTALFFTVFGNDSRFGDYELYIEAKFAGAGGNTFKLKKAYATVGDWTLGYANSTFSDPAAQPPTVDPQGPNAEISDKSVLLRYMHSFKNDITIAASVETPDNKIPTSDQWHPTSDFMPNVAAFVQYAWQKSSHIRLSGIVKGMRYRDMVQPRNHTLMGWGVHASTVFRPASPLTVYGAVNTGRGIGCLINDLQEGSNDLLGLASDPGRMYAPWSYGWYAALQYHFRPDLFSTVMFSQERMLPKHDAQYTANDYKYGWYATANLFWDITPRCEVGLEYNMGRRMNMDHTSRMAYRLCMCAQFSF